MEVRIPPLWFSRPWWKWVNMNRLVHGNHNVFIFHLLLYDITSPSFHNIMYNVKTVTWLNGMHIRRMRCPWRHGHSWARRKKGRWPLSSPDNRDELSWVVSNSCWPLITEMSLQWSLVAGLLYSELAITILLLVPHISNRFWSSVVRISFLR